MKKRLSMFGMCWGASEKEKEKKRLQVMLLVLSMYYFLYSLLGI